MFSLYYYMNLIKFIKYGKYRNYTKLSRFKSVSSIDDDYLEAVTGAVLKNLAKLTGKHLCCSLFLIKLQACKLIEKKLQHWCFPLHVKTFLRTPTLKSRVVGSDYSTSKVTENMEFLNKMWKVQGGKKRNLQG